MLFIAQLVEKPKAWLLLAITALLLEGCALFFQYAMNLQPCIMCVYQRVAVLSILLAGVIGYISCRFVIGRFISYGLWGTGAIWGLLIAKEHVAMQSETFSLFFSCETTPNFPHWLPLHEWLPQLFAATGSCGDINWQFMSYSMPQWMMFIFGSYSVVFALVLLIRIAKTKML
jgi:disulfide bond formation protein DsbB